MTVAVVRPDLSQRTALSKSALVAFDLCQQKAFFEIHNRRPLLRSEKVSFGSALDAATEALIAGARDGRDATRAVYDAIIFVEQRDEIELDAAELDRAVRGFTDEVMPKFDWTGAATQPDLWAVLPGIGEVNGHPDIVLASNAVWDVKSSTRDKVLPSMELGLYALLLEAAQGVTVPEVGYLTWIRSGKGRWAIQRQPVDDELRRWSWEHLRRFSAAKALDAQLNEGAETPTNVVFAGGPKFAGLCGDCQYAPWNGGGCALAYGGGTEE